MTIKPIRNASDLSATKTRLASLLAKNSGEFDDEIEVLTTLIEQYEEKFARVDPPDPIAAIKFRMEEKGSLPVSWNRLSDQGREYPKFSLANGACRST